MEVFITRKCDSQHHWMDYEKYLALGFGMAHLSVLSTIAVGLALFNKAMCCTAQVYTTLFLGLQQRQF